MNQPFRDYQASNLTNTGVATQELSGFMSRVYRWMALGVFITALTAHYVAITPQIFTSIFHNSMLFWSLIILQFGVVIFLSAAIRRITAFAATALYLSYSVLTGLTLSVIFLIYTQQSINSAFIVTAVSFAGLSAFGYFTKRDLGPIGTFCNMALWGFVAVILLSYFMPKMMGNSIQIFISIAGIVIFAGLTAYNTQKIKSLAYSGGSASDTQKSAIYGALLLYLDFINLFLNILRLMGQRR